MGWNTNLDPEKLPKTFITFLLVFAFSNPLFAIPQEQNSPYVQTYEQLISAIRQVRSASQARIEQAVEHEKVREAWETGELIDEHILFHKRADYDKEVIRRLARDLGDSERELYYMLEFARTYPILRTSAELTWGHYETLLAVNDDQEREEIEMLAAKENWPIKKLRQEIKKRKLSVSDKLPLALPEIKPGKIGTCRTVKLNGRLQIDLGFDLYHDLPEKHKKKLKEGDFVFVKQKGSSYALTKVPSVLDDLYTYPATVLGLADGDTFYALIELGFGTRLHQRLRLRRLDAPEIISAEGKQAKAALEKVLSRAKGPLVIKVSKTDDQYGRYLADVWVNGKNIDQELLGTEFFQVRADA